MQREFRIEEKSVWEGLMKVLRGRDGGKRGHVLPEYGGWGSHMLAWREEAGKEGSGIGP